ncbi:MAG: HWE histidine kinase domain-containing protein [Devosia sp.]
MAKIVKKSPEQQKAEAAVKGFADDLGPFVVAADETRMAMVFADAREPDNPIIFANDSFLALTGFERRQVMGQSFNFFLAQIADETSLARIAAELANTSTDGTEVLYRRKDGSEFWAAVFISPVRDADGKVVQYFASFVDLTKLMLEKAHLRMLVDELNHRVKNTLATVQSIVWQALRFDADPMAAREAIENRLFALSRSHDLLSSQNWKSASLFDLTHQAIAPFELTDRQTERITIAGPDIRMPPKAALALGIALNELATNAAKYGALSSAAGRLMVQWQVLDPNGQRHLEISWRESGGPIVTPPSRRGFGSHVLQSGLVLELGAAVHLHYLPQGLQCTINIPLSGDIDE